MNEASVILNQVIIMFILMVVGYTLRRIKFITDSGVREFSNILVYVASPSIMIMSFDVPFSAEKARELLVAFGLAVLVMVIPIIVSRLVFKKTDTIEQFAVIFNNCAFLGIPLVQAVLGMDAVFYLTILIAVWNLFSWSYGIFLLTGDRNSMSLQKVFLNPATISVVIGLILFLSPLKLPNMAAVPLTYLGNLNTPLAMIVLGSYLANINLREIFTSRKGYIVSAFRLIIVPLITMGALSLVPDTYFVIKMTMLIAACTPSAATLAIFSQMFGADYEYGARIVSLTTILSLITIPSIMTIASMLWT